MGQKLCAGSNDTPLVTFHCNFVHINRSPNTTVDCIDAAKQEEDDDSENPRLQCCCLSWRRPQKKGNTKKKKGREKQNVMT